MLKGRFITRLKSTLASGISEVLTPTAKDVLRDKLNKKLIELKKSSLGRNIEIAREYYKLEMAPPTKHSEWKLLREDFLLVKNGKFKNITVKDAWLFFLVCTEVGLWFYMGETIGKRHIVGYKV